MGSWIIAFDEGVVVLVGLGGGIEWGTDTVLGFDEEFEEGGAVETLVLPVGVSGLVLSHSVKETQEEWRGIIGGVDAFVTQFAYEATVSPVDGLVDDTNVVFGVIEDIAVDMIHHFAFGSIGDVIEGAGREIMTVFVAVLAHFGVRYTSFEGSPIGFVTMCRLVTCGTDEVAVGVLVECFAVDDFGRHLDDEPLRDEGL